MVERVDPSAVPDTDEARIDARIVSVRIRSGPRPHLPRCCHIRAAAPGHHAGPASAVSAWQDGTGRWIEDWDSAAEACRASFATLIGARTAEIATQPAVSVAVATVAASLQPGDEVVVPDNEFTSVLYPLLVAEHRGVRVRQVPLGGLPDAIHAGTTLVATSLVQMQTGIAAPLGGILEAAGRHGARVLVDATQAIPMRPSLPSEIGAIDYLVCAGYKHLLCPRGVAFLYVREPPGTRSHPSPRAGAPGTCRTAATSADRSSWPRTQRDLTSPRRGSAGSARASRCGC